VGEKKEDDEGIRFHTSLTTATHRRDRILRRKLRRLSVLLCAVSVLFVLGSCTTVPGGSSPIPGGGLQERGGAAGGRAGSGKGRRAGGAERAHRELATFWWRVKVQEERAALAAGVQARGQGVEETHGRLQGFRRCRGRAGAG
jgi:hypothetical protein